MMVDPDVHFHVIPRTRAAVSLQGNNFMTTAGLVRRSVAYQPDRSVDQSSDFRQPEGGLAINVVMKRADVFQCAPTLCADGLNVSSFGFESGTRDVFGPIAGVSITKQI